MKSIVLLVIFLHTVFALKNGLATTPPMGWSTWNTFYCNYNEAVLMKTAQAMVNSGMRDAGYVYLNIDDCWMSHQRDPRTGELVPDPAKFPNGMASFAKYIHSLGLKLGLYTSSGNYTCQGYPGSWGNEEKDALTFAKWGADFVKVDACHMDTIPQREISFTLFSNAVLNASKIRPMVLSCATSELMLKANNREFPWIWGPPLCNMARIWWDISDSWQGTLDLVDHARNLEGFAGPGFWNDMDIMTVGMSSQSIDEYKSLFSLWSIFSAPLIAGNDLRSMSDEIAEVLTNGNLIAVNQYPVQGSTVRTSLDGQLQIFAKPIPSELLYRKNAPPRKQGQYNPLAQTYVVGFLNRGTATANLTFNFRDDLYKNFLCCPPPIPNITANVFDVWTGDYVGQFMDEITVTITPHSTVVRELEPL